MSKKNKASENGVEVDWKDATIVRADRKPDYVGSLD